MPDQADPTGGLTDRKLLELRDKLEGVDVEFTRWLEDTGQGRPLRKHRSQIERLTGQLSGLADRVGQEIDRLPSAGDDVLAACRTIQLRILEVHRLWDYFRSKLNLRYVAWFRDYLLVADEFAWACYQPAQAAADADALGLSAGKAPPLVFLSGEFSPFTHPRQQPFKVEDVPDALDSLEFLQVAHALPIPLIGLPWYQVAHLPDAVLIAHEVGHTVERDLQLVGTTEDLLRAATATAPAPRPGGWFTWAHELFADLYGVLAAGPAYTLALADLLATDPAQAAAEAAAGPPWTPHPPASLRVAITTHALERTGFAEEAKRQWATWTGVFGPNPHRPFADDVAGVVDALLDGRYRQLRSRTLQEVVSFSAVQQRAATTAANSILASVQPPTGDIRSLICCARLAFAADPAGYRLDTPDRTAPQDLILARARGVIGDDPRGRDQADEASPPDDRQAGAALFDLIDKVKQQRARRDT